MSLNLVFLLEVFPKKKKKKKKEEKEKERSQNAKL
jgi:hypothetical protein